MHLPFTLASTEILVQCRYQTYTEHVDHSCFLFFFLFQIQTGREGDNYEETGQQREVHIKFYCNPNKPFGTPTFSEQEGNKYFFDFQTSLVCSASSVQCAVSGNGKFYDLTPLGLTDGELCT